MTPEDKINAIHAALVGNEELGHVGLVKRIEAMQRDVGELKRFRDTLKAKASVIATLAGALGASIVEWIKTRTGSSG